MKTNITFILISILLPVVGFSQSSRLKHANKLFNTQSYYYAAEAYEDCLARKTDSTQIANNIAYSYDKTHNTTKALDWYRFLNRKATISKEQQLRLALLEREVGNYSQSEALMSSYGNKYGELDVSKSVVSGSSSIEKLKTNNSNFELVEQKKVNTGASEMGANFYTMGEILVASSARRKMSPNRIHSWTGKHFYDLYKAPVDKDGQIGKMKIVKGQVQSKFNDGPAVYNSTSGYFYFTRNNFLDGKKGMDENRVIRLKVFRAKMDGNKFTDAEEMSFNSDAYSNAHPTLSKDGKRMYFSSDRPGGFGGMDIYSVNLDANGNTVGDPVNMGNKINTTQNDAFPSYNDQENILFFSSEGHSGLGGMDVFAAKLNKQGKASSIENLGAPINSSQDDLSFVSNPTQTMGYFSSDRKGGKGDDDIYSFKQKAPIKNSATVKGNAKDLLAGTDIENATIYLTDKNGKIIDSAKTTPDGNFEFSLRDIDDDFKLKGAKDGYVMNEKVVSYNADKMEYNQDLKLMPELDYYFKGIITDKSSGEPLSNVKVIISDNIKNTSFEEVLTQEAGTFKTVTLPYIYNDNVNYKFKLERAGYLSKSLDVKELLGMEAELTMKENLSFSLDKIEVGKTDLANILDLEPIYFDLNSSDIRKDATLELDKVVSAMNENPQMIIELGSHTDQRESDRYNLWLSERRAKSSANYIISKGISKDRIKGKGYGELSPKKSQAEIDSLPTKEAQEEMYQLNRRTEFIIVKMK